MNIYQMEKWKNVYDNSIMVDSCATHDQKGKLWINSLRDSQGKYLNLLKQKMAVKYVRG